MDAFRKAKKREKLSLFERLEEYNKFRKKVRYVVKTHSDWVDETLVSFFQQFYASLDSFSLVAVGGYGRRQLNPFSDIDLLLISEDKGPIFEGVVRDIYDLFYFLEYDISISFRSIEECVEYAVEDDTIMTSLVDSRFIYGEKRIFEKFLDVFRKVFVSKKEEFVERKLEYLRSRYKKYGNTVFVLEPNVKEGVGGLRDYHTLIWVSKALFNTHNALDMKKSGIMDEDDYIRLRDGVHFLWQIRNVLHFSDKRKSDVLHIDMRDKVASSIGVLPNNRFSATERLMRKYYYNTRNIERVANLYLDSFFQKKDKSEKYFFLDSSIKVNGRLEIETKESSFSEFLFLLYYSALYSKAISAAAFKKAKKALCNVSTYKSSEMVRFIFRDILSLNVPVVHVIRAMHEIGFLGKYIPEFGNVCCLTEDSFYHKYTVDEHSIQALGYLDELFEYDIPKTFVMRLSYIWRSLKPHERFVLRLATLLHDVGKIKKEHHEIVGAEMVERISKRMNLGNDITKLLKFLVRYHLFISRIVSTLDIEDPKTLENFIKVVDNKEKLNLLVLLTYADMKAVNDNVWTSWKEALIETLYLKATYYFENKDYNEYMRLRAADSKRKIKAILGKEYASLVDNFPDVIFNDIDFRSMAVYIKDIKDTGRNVFVYREKDSTEGKIVVYYDNKPGFFNKISGILACLDINIITAKSYNLNSAKIVDIFVVKFSDNTDVNDYRIEDMLAEVEKGRLDLEDCMNRQRNRFVDRLNRAKLEMAVQNVDVKIDNESSDLYTVVRVYAPDRIGLVYYITKVFSDFRLQVGMFILDTKGAMAVDTFYIVDEHFRKIYSSKMVELLKSKLYGVLI